MSSENRFIKENLKPQTLLVDFDPNRLFRMQEQKSLIYNVNTEENGNSKLRERIVEELRISPIIMMNNNKIKQVEATNILEAVSEYNNQRSVSDEVVDIPVDLSLLNDGDIRRVIEAQGEFNSKQGMTIDPNQGYGEDLDIEEPKDDNKVKEDKKDKSSEDYSETKTADEVKKLESQIKTYYQRLLFYSFLTKDKISSLDDILGTLEKSENQRIANNLHIDKEVLQKISDRMDPFKRSSLDYKIQNISMLVSDESIAPLDRAMTSIKKFNRMSESEVITPSKVCDEMVALLPEEGLRKIVDKQDKLLDIASKSGEYAVSLYKRLTFELGYSHEYVKDIIYSIPTSSIAYEFTRRFYEILNLNVDNISAYFNAYDLIELKDENGEVDYIKINDLLKQDRTFNGITLKDEIKVGENKVKFGAVIGNPPYQISDGGAQESAKPIYQQYVFLSKELEPEDISMIIPSRWFSGGKGLQKFRKEMLSDKRIKTLVDFENFRDVFPGVDLAGGACYFLIDNAHFGETVIVNKSSEGANSSKRSLDEFDIFIRQNLAVDIVKKVLKQNTKFFNDRISSRKPFSLPTNYKPKESGVPCWFIQKIGKKYASNSDVVDRFNMLDKWKLLVPKSPIAGQTDFSKPVQFYYDGNTIIAKPGECCTESFIVLGAFDTEEEVLSFKTYIFSKVVRFLLLQTVVSQDVTKKNYCFVPDLIHYNENYTDEHLRRIWEINDKEWSYIDSRIR